MNSKTLSFTTKAEQDMISRNVLIWINTFPEKPVDIIRYEYLVPDQEGMALSTIQGAYITQRDVLGNYQAEYQFKVIYRIKPGTSNDRRLQADELLNRLGDWATENSPDLGEGIEVIQVETTARASYFDAYENGDEDYQILMKLTYEVNKYG